MKIMFYQFQYFLFFWIRYTFSHYMYPDSHANRTDPLKTAEKYRMARNCHKGKTINTRKGNLYAKYESPEGTLYA